MMNTGTLKLWTIYREDGTTEQRNRIICEYLPLAQAAAGRISKHLVSFVDYDEIEGAAYFGLLNAVERYDPTLKIKFETFSYPRIHGAIMDWLRLHDQQSRTIRKFEKARDQAVSLLSMNGPVAEEDVIRHLKMSNERYLLLSTASHRGQEIYLSFLERASNVEHPYQIEDSTITDPSSAVETKVFMDYILTGLPQSERTLIRYYYFGDLTLKQIGKKLGLTESRTSQIKAAAHEHIRRRLQNRNPSFL